MGKVLEIIGWVVVVATIIAIVVITAITPRRFFSVWVLMLGGLPTVFSGVVIAALGRMLTQLVGIRESNERQELILSSLQAPRTVSEPGSGGFIPSVFNLSPGKEQCPSCGRINSTSEALCECGMAIKS